MKRSLPPTHNPTSRGGVEAGGKGRIRLSKRWRIVKLSRVGGHEMTQLTSYNPPESVFHENPSNILESVRHSRCLCGGAMGIIPNKNNRIRRCQPTL